MDRGTIRRRILLGLGAMKYDSGKVLLVADIAGTYLFGIEGADAAIRGNLDLLGLMVLAFSTALAGGVVRDLLIGRFRQSPSRTGGTQRRHLRRRF
jgi:hypothetical protein